MLPEMKMGDVVRLRKPHPCGNTDWVVVRLGADIRLKCLGCGRRILLPQSRNQGILKIIRKREFLFSAVWNLQCAGRFLSV